jgi:hypothetical protein
MRKTDVQSIASHSVAEREAITIHTASLERIVGIIKPFNGKVVNKRMIDAIKAEGIHVGWSDNWEDKKEMTLHHGYSQEANEYAEYYRTVTVPLVIEEGRLDYAATEQAITEFIARLQRKYLEFGFEPTEYDDSLSAIKGLLAQINVETSAVLNPFARQKLLEMIRRGG